MSGQHDGTDEGPGPDDESAADVSRLLAAAAGPPEEARIPGDVARRLDDVLAGLASERAEVAGSGPVAPNQVTGATDLSPRRRRRWPRLLVAAAAVSVIGLGIGNLLDDFTTGAGDAQSTAESADAGALSGPGGSDQGQSQGDESVAPEVEPESRDLALTGAVPRLRTESLTVEVQRIEDFSLAAPVARTRARLARACVQPPTGPGDEWLRVRLDGDPAVLVLRAATGGRRTADVFTCEDADLPAASTTVAAR